jgi:hypothetical protein
MSDNRFGFRPALYMLATLLLVNTAFAQTFRSRITGMVSDESKPLSSAPKSR